MEGFKKIRNNIIAHNHRVNGKSIFDYDKKINYNIPAADREYTFLADLIFIIAQNIYSVFPEVTNKIDFNKSLHDQLQVKADKINTVEKLRQIEKEINENKYSI